MDTTTNTKYRNARTKKKSTISNSDTIQNNYIRIEMMRQEEKSRWSTNITAKNMLTFFPTYTTLVDNQIKDMYVHKICNTGSVKENCGQGSDRQGQKNSAEKYGKN